MPLRLAFLWLAAATAVFTGVASGGETLSLSGEWRLDYWNQPYPEAVRALPLPDGASV